MTIQDFGAIGEIVGAAAVVVSLIYLASQIRQNTRQINQNTTAAQATAFDSAITHTMMARQAIFQDAEVARIYHDGSLDPESLSDNDRLRYRLIAHNILWSIWNLQSQSAMGGDGEEMRDTQVPLLRRVVSQPGMRWFWLNWSQEFGPSFRQEVERILVEIDAETSSE
jgi:hypothetical protein